MGATCRFYRAGILEKEAFSTEDVSDLLEERDALVWLDIDQPNEESMRMLGEEFGFHELALEDCLHPHQRPKIEQYGSYFFVVAYGMETGDRSMTEHEIAMFVGRNFLVTVRKDPAFDLGPVIKRWDARSDLAGEGGGYLLYVLLDEVVDGYFEALDFYEDRSEDLDERVFGGGADSAAQGEIFRLKKDLVVFRRTVAPLRDVLDVMQRRTIDVVTPALEPYYRDVYDHVLRVTDYVDGLRDILSSALEAQLAVVSNRLNEVMKTLTSWAAIILVPTLIAGIYGMNFRHIPELDWLFGYPFALGLMLISGGVLYRMFKRRHWL